MKLEALRTEVRQLKDTINEERQKVNDGGLQNISSKASKVKKRQMKSRKTLKGHTGKVVSLHWAGDSQHLVSGAQDGKLLIWNSYTSNKMNVVPLKSSWLMSCTFAPSGNYVASGGLDNMCTVHKLDTQDGMAKVARIFNDYNSFLACCGFLDDTRILTGSGEACSSWDVETGMKLNSYEGHHNGVLAMSFSEEKNILATCSSDKSAKTWDLRTGECCHTFEGHLGDVNGVTIFPSAQAIATTSDDSSCRLFDIRSDQEVIMYYNESITATGTSVAISKSGRLLIAGYDDYNSLIWDVVTGEKNGGLPGHESRISCLNITDCGNAIASGSWDASLRVWN